MNKTTVAEMIAELQELPPDAECVVSIMLDREGRDWGWQAATVHYGCLPDEIEKKVQIS